MMLPNRLPALPRRLSPAISREARGRHVWPRLGLGLLLGLGASGLAACSVLTQTPQIHGNMVDHDQLSELVPGTSTTKDATSLLGSPTAHASFDDNVWIYIGEVTQNRVGQMPAERRQQVVTLTFDNNGVLQSLQDMSKKDAKNVSVVARTTPSPGTEASIMQQLLGNIGRYNPIGGASTAGGPGGGLAGGMP